MKINTFLIRASNNEEAVMRLPVNTHGGITPKGFKIVRERFSVLDKVSSLQYALNLEAFSNGESLVRAIEKYQKNTL